MSYVVLITEILRKKGVVLYITGLAFAFYGQYAFLNKTTLLYFTIFFLYQSFIYIMYMYLPVVTIDVIIQNFMEECQTKSANTIDSSLNCFETYQKIEKALEKYLCVHYGVQQVLIIVVLFQSISSFLNNDYTTVSAAEVYKLIGYIFQILGRKNNRGGCLTIC